MAENNRRCGNCKLHDIVIGGDKTIITICRASPPQVLSTFVQGQGCALNVVQSNVWPQMKHDDWCGRFELQLNE
jgi:hypothetical protein